MRTTVRFATVTLIGASLTACGGNSESSGSSETLIVAIPGTPQGIDLDRQAGPQTWSIAGQVFDLGMEWKRIDYPFEPSNGIDNNKIRGFTYPAIQEQEVEAALLTSCDLSDDDRTATYHLRKGVKSAAGNEFTSDDVLYRVERAIGNKAIGAFMLGAVGADERSQWTAPDKYTVRVTSEEPMPLACKVNTNQYWTFPDSAEIEKHATPEDPWANEWVATHGSGYGAYYVKSWQPGQQVVLKANPNYYKGVPQIKTIIYKVIPESSNRVALIQRGEVQMVEGLSPEDVIALKGHHSVNVAAVRSSLSIYAVMDNTMPPFDNPKVRQAINYAIPRQEIVDNIYRGLALPWEGVMTSLYPGHQEFNTYETDLTKAKALLAEAGYPDGFETKLSYSTGDPVQSDVAVSIQSSLAQIGIDATLQQQPPGPYSDLVQSKKATFALWVDFPIQPDSNYAMRLWYLTDNAVNYQNYSDPEVDRILDQCLSVSGNERLACNEEAQPIIHADAPLGYIAEPNYLLALSSRLSGAGWYSTQYYRVADMALDE